MTTLRSGPGRFRRPTVRVRLTALFGALFLVAGAGLLAVTYILVDHATSNETVTIVYPDGGSARSTVDLNAPVDGPEDELSFGQVGNGDHPVPDAATMRQIAREQHDHRMITLLSQSAIGLAGMAVVGVLLGWLMAGRVLHPLTTITESTQRITATNLHERLALPGPQDEIVKLGNTIDALLERLEHAFQAQQLFVANASHELRTPLARARAVAQIALDDPDATAATLRAAHHRVLAAGTHQQHILDALLALAQGQVGTLRREAVDLSVLVADAVTQRRADAERRGITITMNVEPAETTGDPRLLERLVGNLIDNAVRHNHINGTIEVRTRDHPARLVVANTGPVIPAAAVQGLTEPFQRQTHRTGDGHGLGLSIVKAVAETHGVDLVITPLNSGGLSVCVTAPDEP